MSSGYFLRIFFVFEGGAPEDKEGQWEERKLVMRKEETGKEGGNARASSGRALGGGRGGGREKVEKELVMEEVKHLPSSPLYSFPLWHQRRDERG